MNNVFGNFALICSGANRKILEQEECETERIRYKMIGGFIFLTAVFATLSGGYALYTGFKSAWLAAIIGLIWGFFIFNLDRFIISTIRKKEVDPDLPWFQKLYLKSGEIFAALPRLLFAVFVSIVITTPLELKYFEPEIQVQIDNKYSNAAIDIEKEMGKEFPKIEELEADNEKLQQELKKKEEECERRRVESIDEAEGTKGTLKVGKGPVYREKLQAYSECKESLKELGQQTKAKIAGNNEKLKPLNQNRDKRAEERKQTERGSDGFLKRLTALYELSSGPGPVRWVGLFLTVLFILLETTPILMKLLSKRGPYDHFLETEEYKVYLNQQKIVSDMNEQMNNELALNTLKRDAQREAEEKLIQEVMDDIRTLAQQDAEDAMAEVAKDFISEWKKKNLGNHNGAGASMKQP